MTTVTITYGTSTAYTLSLTGLASSATLVAGRQSTSVDNTTAQAVSYAVGGKIKAGSGTPIAGQFELWAYASYDGTTYVGEAVITGTDGAATLTIAGKPELKQLFIQPMDTTASHVYSMGTFSMAQAFGGDMPKKHGLWCVHNSSAAFTATAADYEFKYTSISYTST